MTRLQRSCCSFVTMGLLATNLASLGCAAGDARTVGRGRGSGSDDGGTLIVAMPADVSTLLPPYAIASQEQMVISLLFDRLAEPGDSLNTLGDQGFVPRLADRWDWSRDSLSIVFHLDPRARWHDGVPVRSNDVVFTFGLYTNPAAGIETAAELTSIDSVTAPDSLTAIFWFKQRYPEQFFDATYQMQICPAHLLRDVPTADLRGSDFVHHPVGDGRFRFRAWTPGSTIELVADTGNYRGRAKLDRLVLAITPSPGAALTQLLAGEADFYQTVPPASVAEVLQRPDLITIVHTDPSYGFLWFNLRTGTPSQPHPIFSDRRVRQALALALDRASIVRNVYDTLAIVANGPFALSTSSADPTTAALPYDTARADRLLDAAGWRRGPDGVRERAGRPLAFALMVPTSSKVRQQVAVLIQDQLARIGARVTIDPVEMRAMVSRLRAHDFEAALHVWHTDASMSGLRETWTSAAEREGANWGSYESPVFDALVDSALSARDASRTHALLHRAYAQINEDVPAVWLYQPREVSAVQRRVHAGFFRLDAWYAHLADWYIPRDVRLPRDNIGLAAAPR